MAKRSHRRRGTTRRRSSHRRRSYRRNPPRLRGVVGQVTEGVKTGVGVVAGKAVTNLVTSKLGIAGDSVQGIGASLALGVVLSSLAPKMLRGFGKDLAAGAFVAAVENAAVKFSVPFLAPAGVSGYVIPGTRSLTALPNGVSGYAMPYGSDMTPIDGSADF